jgi:hypothetical protein
MENHQRTDFKWYEKEEEKGPRYRSSINCPTISSSNHSPSTINQYNLECFGR